MALCSVGALGVIMTATVQCEPLYQLCAEQTPMGIEEILNNVDTLAESGEHVRFHLFPHTDRAVVWRANRVYNQQRNNPSSFVWDRLVGFHLLELAYFVSAWTTSRLVPLINRATFNVLFSRTVTRTDAPAPIFNFDCLFQQYVDEWAIPRKHTSAALRAIFAYLDKVQPHFHAHFPIEVRFVAPDSIPLSPSFGRDTTYIGIIMYRPYSHDVPYQQFFSAYESIMRQFQGRPHWAKAHQARAAHLSSVYPRFNDFLAVRQSLDPQRKLINPYLERCFFSDTE